MIARAVKPKPGCCDSSSTTYSLLDFSYFAVNGAIAGEAVLGGLFWPAPCCDSASSRAAFKCSSIAVCFSISDSRRRIKFFKSSISLMRWSIAQECLITQACNQPYYLWRPLCPPQASGLFFPAGPGSLPGYLRSALRCELPCSRWTPSSASLTGTLCKLLISSFGVERRTVEVLAYRLF